MPGICDSILRATCTGSSLRMIGRTTLVLNTPSDGNTTSTKQMRRNGVRIGTAEIYRQVEQLDEVLESIAIAQQRHEQDERVVLFVRLRDGIVLDDALREKIRHQIRANTSPHHVPRIIVQVADIPRTISGKITELAVREAVHGRPVSNTDALANPGALELFMNLPELKS